MYLTLTQEYSYKHIALSKHKSSHNQNNPNNKQRIIKLNHNIK